MFTVSSWVIAINYQILKNAIKLKFWENVSHVATNNADIVRYFHID